MEHDTALEDLASRPGETDGSSYRTTALDADELAPDVRVEQIRRLMRESLSVEIDQHPEPEQIYFRGSVVSLGKVQVCSIRSNATALRHASSLVPGHSAPSLFLALQIAESSVVIQDGRQAVLQAGDLAFYDTTRPYTLLHDQGIHQHLFRVPLAEMALPSALLSRMTAVRLNRRSPLPELAARYFSGLANPAAPFQMREAKALAQPSVELLRALICSQGDDEPRIEPAVESALPAQILDYVQAHLPEADLTPARIARANHISLRQLYKIMARSNISLNAWIRTQRLEECRNELARPGSRHLTIAALARRWGFVDPTSFGRAFKAAYGMSPRQWRSMRQS